MSTPHEKARANALATMPQPRTGPDPTGCLHKPPCPAYGDQSREAARTVAHHPEQGWSLLCNGVVTFDDTGELLPDGGVVPPHRPTDQAGSSR